ncbi:MAG: hypothetical protein DDT22_01182 [candidate division WS2 bacterium]|nr:hypothetical protein [Candidatus Lithacetigena glycinireducens]
MNKELKQLQIIEKKEDKEMIEEISSFLEKADKGMSLIQIENFVLNDIEFPTEYGKFVQARFELVHRFQQLTDLYYQIKETEIKIKIKERDTNKEKDELKKELLLLQQEKEEMKLFGFKNQLKRILKEARIFYQNYQKHPEFQKFTPEEEFKLEAENWARKTINMPTIFEERYGENYMKKALGEANYQKYKQLRQKGFGLLPREIFEVKQLKGRVGV